jgi:hypothetical protein
MARFGVIFVLASLFVVSAAPSLLAQNLLSNSTFDSNLTGWTGVGSTFDGANGSPAPGSARVSVVGLTPFSNTGDHFQQCVSVVPGTSYNFGGQILNTALPAGGGTGVGVVWFSDGACATPMIAGLSTLVTTTGSWQGVTGTVTAPAGALSATVQDYQTADATGGDVTVNYDSLFFQLETPVPAMNTWWMAALGVFLAMAAGVAIRRRRATSM